MPSFRDTKVWYHDMIVNTVQFEVISSQTGNRVHSWSGTILEILFRQCYTCLNYIYLPWLSANLSLNCRHSLWFSRLIRRQIFLSMVYWIFFLLSFFMGVCFCVFWDVCVWLIYYNTIFLAVEWLLEYTTKVFFPLTPEIGLTGNLKLFKESPIIKKIKAH